MSARQSWERAIHKNQMHNIFLQAHQAISRSNLWLSGTGNIILEMLSDNLSEVGIEVKGSNKPAVASVRREFHVVWTNPSYL